MVKCQLTETTSIGSGEGGPAAGARTRAAMQEPEGEKKGNTRPRQKWRCGCGRVEDGDVCARWAVMVRRGVCTNLMSLATSDDGVSEMRARATERRRRRVRGDE